jgi:septum formation protein
MNNLFLASSSQMRQHLLAEACFSFKILKTKNTSEPFNPELTLKKNVQAVARFKAKNVILPDPAASSEIIFVITADTLIQDIHGNILQKPKDLAEGKQQLTQLSQGACIIGTAMVVQKITKNNLNKWKRSEKISLYTKSSAEFYVYEAEIDEYFKQLPFALFACGSGIIESFGGQFLKSFNGSYSAALGLPIFELKEILTKLGYQK